MAQENKKPARPRSRTKERKAAETLPSTTFRASASGVPFTMEISKGVFKDYITQRGKTYTFPSTEHNHRVKGSLIAAKVVFR